MPIGGRKTYHIPGWRTRAGIAEPTLANQSQCTILGAPIKKVLETDVNLPDYVNNAKSFDKWCNSDGYNNIKLQFC